jgi:hypothetical protein
MKAAGIPQHRPRALDAAVRHARDGDDGGLTKVKTGISLIDHNKNLKLLQRE